MKSTILSSSISVALSVCVAGAALLSGCSEQSPKKVPMQFDKKEKVSETGGSSVTFSRPVDILFVIDDSGSMGVHQDNMAKNVQLFIQNIFANQILDYHIGVVNSNMDDQPSGGRTWRGELFGAEKFVTRATPNGAAVLEANLKPGTSGSATEKFFTPIIAALTPPMSTGPNKNFFRRDAHLVIIFLTDSDDQSAMAPADLHRELLRLKRGDDSKVITYAAYIPTIDRSCERSGEPEPSKLEQFFQIAKTQTLGLCDADYGAKLAKLGDDLLSRIGTVLYLTRPPRPDTILVTFGTQVIPNDSQKGWIYDPAKNALLFGPDIDLLPEPSGTEVKVDFIAAEYD